jgi:hypothetical protein
MTLGERMIEILEGAGFSVCHGLPIEEADGADFWFEEDGGEWFAALSPEGHLLMAKLRAVRLSPLEALEAAECPSAMCH